MPESFHSITTTIDVMFCQNESNVTFEFVKNKLLMEETKRGSSSKNSDVAFSGHGSQKQRWKRNGQDRKYGAHFPFKCHNCGVVGHKRYQCPKLQRKTEQQANMAEEKDEEVVSFLR